MKGRTPARAAVNDRRGCGVENVKGIWRGCQRVGRERNERNLLSRQQVVVMLPGKWHEGD